MKISKLKSRAIQLNDFFLNRYFGTQRISKLMIYLTTRCNSRCNTCNLWKSEKKDMSVDLFEKIINSKSIKRTTEIGLEGGEIFLHPSIDEIFEIIKGKKFSIITNGLMPDKVFHYVDKYNIPKVSVSLDGIGEVYKKVRGVDGFDKAITTLLGLKDKIEVSAIFTLSPWNTSEDYLLVKDWCDKNGIPVSPNFYIDKPFFDSEIAPGMVDHKRRPADKLLNENDYTRLYSAWLDGEVYFPCFSIGQFVSIWPDGTVPLCQGGCVNLGNVVDSSFDDVWRDKKTRELQLQYEKCNKCWLSFHRAFDVGMVMPAHRFFPRKIFENMFGKIKFPN